MAVVRYSTSVLVVSVVLGLTILLGQGAHCSSNSSKNGDYDDRVTVIPRQLKIAEGASAEFHCYSTNPNSTITWYRRTKRIRSRPGRLTLTEGRDEQKGAWSTFRIESTSKKLHRKKYHCVVTVPQSNQEIRKTAQLNFANKKDADLTPNRVWLSYLQDHTKLNLSWIHPVASGYQVDRYAIVYGAVESPWLNVTEVFAKQWETPQSAIISNLELNTDYHFKIRAQADGNIGVFSDTVHFRTLDESDCVDRHGTKVPQGNDYRPEEDPCVTCTCQGGSPLSCMAVACDIPCKNFTLDADICCGFTCHDDNAADALEVTCMDRKGFPVAVGEVYNSDPDDPCVTCVCTKNGTGEICGIIACDEPRCRPYKIIPDTCCGYICEDKGTVPEVTCMDRKGFPVAVGEVYNSDPDDPCVTCVCTKNGTGEICGIIACDEPRCRPYKIIPDTCCGYICEDKGTVPEVTCMDRKGFPVAVGEVYNSDPDDPCVTCVCTKNGTGEICGIIACDEPRCRPYKIIPDTCCGYICEDKGTASGCLDRKDIRVQEGDVYLPKTDPCVSCVCRDGIPQDCTRVACYIPCENFTLAPDKCCDFTCHEVIEPEPGPEHFEGAIDVRQVGSSLALVQWRLLSPVKSVDVLYKTSDDHRTDSWSVVSVPAGRETIILRTLEHGVKYLIKLRGMSEGIAVETPSTEFFLEHRGSTLLPLHKVLRGVILQHFGTGSVTLTPEKPIRYLNMNSFDMLEVEAVDNPHCHQYLPVAVETREHNACGMIRLYRSQANTDLQLMETVIFTDRLDYNWAVTHI